MTTATKVRKNRDVLNQGDPGEIATILKKAKLGNMLEPIKVTFAGLADVAAHDITTAASKAGATISGGLTLAAGELLPAIGQVLTCRVTAGTGAAGVRVITDAGGTPDATAGQLAVATISDDGKTLTFEAGVTAFVLTYLPRSVVDMDSEYQPNT